MSIFTRRKRTESMTIEEDAVRFVRLKSVDPLVIDVAEEVLTSSERRCRGEDCRFRNACDDIGRGCRTVGNLQTIRPIPRPGSICYYPQSSIPR